MAGFGRDFGVRRLVPGGTFWALSRPLGAQKSPEEIQTLFGKTQKFLNCWSQLYKAEGMCFVFPKLCRAAAPPRRGGAQKRKPGGRARAVRRRPASPRRGAKARHSRRNLNGSIGNGSKSPPAHVPWALAFRALHWLYPHPEGEGFTPTLTLPRGPPSSGSIGFDRFRSCSIVFDPPRSFPDLPPRPLDRPKIAPRPPQDLPRPRQDLRRPTQSPQDPPKSAKDRPTTPKIAPKSPQDHPKTLLGHPKTFKSH